MDRYSRIIKINFIIIFSLIYCSQILCQSPGISSNKYNNESAENRIEKDEKSYDVISSFFKQQHLTGDWYGYRYALENDGIDFNFEFTVDNLDLVNEKVNKNYEYIDLLNLQLTLDLQKILNWKDAIFYVNFFGNRGGELGNESGVVQGISSIEALSNWRLFEFWLNKKILDGKLSFRIGLYDLNTEFDTRETSAIFINPSPGIGPDFAQAGKNGPSIYPYSSMTLRVKYNITKYLTNKFAVLNGVPGDPNHPYGTHIKFGRNDGLLLVDEVDVFDGTREFGKGYSKIGIGGWYFTSKFPDILDNKSFNQPIMRQGNYGIYAFGEKFLFSENNQPEQGLSAFLRIGYADKNVNEFDSYIGGGFIYRGLFNGRDEDVIGFSFAAAHNGSKFREKYKIEGYTVSPFETDLELTYDYVLTPFLHLQPDLQFVLNPVNNHIKKSIFVAGLRIALNI